MIGSERLAQQSRLGNVLIEKGWISQEQLGEALVYQHQRETKLGEALIELGFINQSQLSQALKRQSWSRSTVAGLLLAASQMFIAACSSDGSKENAVEITAVAHAKPSIDITSPTGGSEFDQNTTVTFTANASNANDENITGQVVWVSDIDGELGTGGAISKTLSAGNHTIIAEVTDSNGAEASESITISVSSSEDSAPVVLISSPSNRSSFTEGNVINFKGDANDAEEGDLGSDIRWESSIDGELGIGDNINATLSVGNHIVSAIVTDSADNRSSHSIHLTVQSAIDMAPVVAITSPGNGSSFNAGDNIAFTANASDNEDGNLSASIQWSSNIDGNLGSGSSITSALSTGSHVITASVADSNGQQVSETINVTVNSASATAPQLSITSPSSGSEFNSDESISFSANATDNEDGNLGSSILWSSNLDGQLGSGANFSAQLSAGSHTITASVNDSDGNQANKVIQLTVSDASNVPPELAITSPSSGDSFNDAEAISFTATANDEEEGNIGHAIQWNSSIDGDFGSGANVSQTLSSGSHVITATVSDTEGESVSQVININVTEAEDAAPTIAITSPTGGSSIPENETVTFTASASDDEDGDLGSSIVWYSDMDGQIGQGSEISPDLTTGEHQITAEVTDSQGQFSQAQIQITVIVVDGVAIVSWQPPVSNTDETPLSGLAGFKIYYGDDQNNLNNVLVINDPLQLSYDFDWLIQGKTYYFAVTAYSNKGSESAMSSIVSKQL